MIKIRVRRKQLEEDSKSPSKETDRDRKSRIFGDSWNDFIRLSKGIAEMDSMGENLPQIDEKSKSKSKGKPNCVPSNPFHYPANSGKKSGQFTSKDKAGSWSLYFSSKGKDCSGKKSGRARVSGGKELFQKKCGRKTADGSEKHKQKCSEKAIDEEQNDFTNCKTTERDKKYSVDKKTGKQNVEIDSKLECDYLQQPDIDKKTLMRWKKLALLQKKYEAQPQIKIAKPIFKQFMAWMDQNA